MLKRILQHVLSGRAGTAFRSDLNVPEKRGQERDLLHGEKRARGWLNPPGGACSACGRVTHEVSLCMTTLVFPAFKVQALFGNRPSGG